MKVYKFVKSDPLHDNGYCSTIIVARDYSDALLLYCDLCRRLNRKDLLTDVSVKCFGELKVGVLDSDIEHLT